MFFQYYILLSQHKKNLISICIDEIYTLGQIKLMMRIASLGQKLNAECGFSFYLRKKKVNAGFFRFILPYVTIMINRFFECNTQYYTVIPQSRNQPFSIVAHFLILLRLQYHRFLKHVSYFSNVQQPQFLNQFLIFSNLQDQSFLKFSRLNSYPGCIFSFFILISTVMLLS